MSDLIKELWSDGADTATADASPDADAPDLMEKLWGVKAPPPPRGAAGVAADLGKSAVGALVQGAGNLGRGLGEVAHIGGEGLAKGLNAATGSDFFRSENPVDTPATAVENVGKKITDSRSAQAKKAEEDSTPTGDLFKGQMSLGAAPSLEGYLHHGINLLGQMAPILIAGAVTDGAAVPAMLVGGAQQAGSAARSARDEIANMDDAKLAKESKVFRDLVAGGMDTKSAREQLSNAAEEWAAGLNAPIGAAGGVVTGKLISKAGGEKLAGAVASRLGRAGVAAGIEGVDNAAQGVAGGVASNVAMNQAAGTDKSLGEGSVANALMGLLGGGVVGGARGLVAHGAKAEDKQPEAPASRALVDQALTQVGGAGEAIDQQRELQAKIAVSLAGMDDTDRVNAISRIAGGDQQLATKLHAMSQDQDLIDHANTLPLSDESGVSRVDVNELIRKDAGLVQDDAVAPPTQTEVADQVTQQLDAQQPDLNSAGYQPEPLDQLQAQVDAVKQGRKQAAVMGVDEAAKLDLNGLEPGRAIDPHTGEEAVVVSKSADLVQQAVTRAQEVGLKQAMGEALGYANPELTGHPDPAGAAVVQQVDPQSGHVLDEQVVRPQDAGNVKRVPGTELHFTDPVSALASRAEQRAQSEPGLSPFPGPETAAPSTPSFHGGKRPAVAGAGEVVGKPSERTNGLAKMLNEGYGLQGEHAIKPDSIHEVAPKGDLSKIARALKWATGTDVVFFHTPEGAAMRESGERFQSIRGVADPENNRVYMNVETASAGNTLAHEIAHVMEVQAPEAYAKLEDAVFSRLRAGRAHELRRNLEQAMHEESGADKDAVASMLRKELVAEAIGELGQDHSLWGEAFKSIGEDRGLAAKFVGLVQKIVSRFQTAFTREGYITGTKDMQSVSRAFQEAYQGWAREHAGKPEPLKAAEPAPAKVAKGKPGKAPPEPERVSLSGEEELAAKIGNKDAPYTPTANDLAENPKVAHAYTGVRGMLAKAELHEEKFISALHAIVADLPAGSVELDLGKIKGAPRAFAKAWADYGGRLGNPDAATKLKDLLRATLVIKDIEDIPKIAAVVAKHMPGTTLKINSYDVMSEAVKKQNNPTGYRGAIFNAKIDGFPVELQANHAVMMAAKKIGHKFYEQAAEIERSLPPGHELSPVQKARVEALESRQRALYVPAYFRVLEESAKARKSASEMGLPKSSSILEEAKEPSEVNSARPGDLSTATPSSSQKDVPSGKDSGNGEGSLGKEAMPHSTADRQAGETDKQYAKRVVDKEPRPEVLPESHASYFSMDEGTKVVPIDDIISTKTDEENKQGGDNGPKRMKAASEGRLSKRGPISVEPAEGGKYKVVDGNGTLTAAKSYGWKTLPVKIEEPAHYTHAPVVELPVAKLGLSKDVPQFKDGADEKGITSGSKLHGKFDRRLAAPIQVWERKDGSMEVISGRHRLDLAQRSGENTIPAQVHREADGFTEKMARVLDIELNVKDGRGKVKDYVAYFKELKYDQEQARAEGLLNTAIGRQAYQIADSGSESLIAAHKNGAVSDDAAVAIAQNAPRNEALQALGLRYVMDGKPTNFAVNMMRAARAAGLGEKGESNGDLFGNDDTALKEAEAISREAVKQQNAVRQELSAIRGAAKRPELAAKGGVQVKDQAATQKRIAELESRLRALESFDTHPEVIAELREAAGLSTGLTRPSEGDILAQQEHAKQAEAAEAKAAKDAEAKAKADAEVPEFKLSGSDRPADANPDQFDLMSAPPLSRDWLDRAEKSEPNLAPALVMGSTPRPLTSGTRISEKLPIIMEARIARKLLEGKVVKGLPSRGEMSHADIAALPDLLKDPVAVFKSAAEDKDGKPMDAAVVVTSRVVDGAPVVIAIHRATGREMYEITDVAGIGKRVTAPANKLASAYPKDIVGYRSWIDKGLLRYVNPAKLVAEFPAAYRLPLDRAVRERPAGLYVEKNSAPAVEPHRLPEALVASKVNEAQGPTNPNVSKESEPVKAPGPRTLVLKKKPDPTLQRNIAKSYSVREMLDMTSTGKLPYDLGTAIERRQWAEAYRLAKDPAERRNLMRQIGDKVIQVAADSLVPVKRWIDKLPVSDLMKQRLSGDMYRAATIRAALEKEVKTKFTDKLYDAIGEASKASKLSLEQTKALAGTWMTAKYAPKANRLLESKDRAALIAAQRTGNAAKIAEAQKNLQDRLADINGAIGAGKTRGVAGGLNNAEAAQLVRNVEGKIDPALLQKIAEPVYDMMAWRKAQDLASGRVSRTMVNSWPNHRDYVPLTGDPRATPLDADVFSGGNHLNQDKEHAMNGRVDSVADNGLDAALEGTIRSINHASVQEFKQSLMKAHAEALAAGQHSGMTVDSVSGLTRLSDDAIIYRDTFTSPTGQQEQRAYALRFADPKIIEALKKDSIEQVPTILKATGLFNRIYGRAVTQFTLTFAPINFVRDTWERSELLRTRKLVGANGQQIDVGSAANSALVDSINPEVWRASFDSAFKTGRSSAVRNDLEQMLRLGGNSVWGDYLARQSGDFDKEMRRHNNVLVKAGSKVAHLVEGYSQMFEMVPALTAFRALKAQGMEPKDAAAAVLDLMNFKKKGTAMPAVRALYVFAQPNATSAYNLAQYLSTRTGQKRFIAQAAIGGILYASLRQLWGDEDDKELGNKLDNLSNYTIERSIPVKIPGTNVMAKVPVGFGPPQLAWVAASIANRWASGRYTGKDALAEVGKGWVKSIAPVAPSDMAVGEHFADWFFQTATPTAIKPLLNIALDTTALGGKLTPGYVNPNQLKSEQANRTTAPEYTAIAHHIYEMTGVDMFPDQVKALTDGYLVGPLHEMIAQYVDNPAKVQRGEPQHMAGVASIVDNLNDRAVLNSIYYRYRQDIADANRAYHSDPEANETLQPMAQAYDIFQHREKVIGTMRSALKKAAPNMEPEELSERTQAIEQKADEVHRELLLSYLNSK